MDVDEGRDRLRQLLAGEEVFYGELDDVLGATGIDEATLRELAIPGSNPISGERRSRTQTLYPRVSRRVR